MLAPIRRCLVARRDRGEADPWLLMMSLAVSVVILGGITLALTHISSWAKVYAVDAAQQHTEDAAALAWTDDVGLATAVVPGGTIELPASYTAARRTARATLNATLTSQSAVRFDNGTPGGTCVATAWWITPTPQVAPGASKNLTDNDTTHIAGDDGLVGTGDDSEYFQIHRQEATYAATLANGRCDTTTRPTSAGTDATPVSTADSDAHIAYFNDFNRDLHFTAGVEQGVGASNATKAPFRSDAEWASAVPAQVRLVMSVDHEVTGKGVGVQAASQVQAAPQQVTGDPNSGFLDGKDTDATSGSEDNPDRSPAPVLSPTVTAVTAAQAENDSITVTRTETRALDGFELECREYDDEAATTPAGGRPMARQSIASASAVTLAGTSPGKTYVCRQTGWVSTSVGAVAASADPNSPTPIPASGIGAGKVYTAGPFGPDSAPVTRRSIAPSLTISVPGASAPAGGTAVYADGSTAAGTVTWPAIVGATSYQVTYALNGGAWSAPVTVPASGAPSWTTPVIAEDTHIDVRVQSVNVGGTSDLPGRSVVSAENRVDTPAPSMPNPANSTQTASWGARTNAAGYDVEWAYNGAWQGASHVGAGTLSTSRYVEQGDSVHFRVRGTGANTQPGLWATIGPVTRPVDPPSGVGIAAQSAGSTEGNATATAGGGCSGGTQIEFWWRDDRGNSRGWSTDPNAAAQMYEGDTNTFYFSVRCHNTTTGVVSPEVGTQTSGLYRAYTAPSAPGISDSGDGVTGTNVTFSWTDTSGVYGGYYQLVNASYSTRYEGTGRSYTTGREAGSTCGRVRAAKNSTAAAQGAWSGWSGLTCATTTVPAPGVPTVSGTWKAYLGKVVDSDVVVSAVSNATSYQVQGQACDSTGYCMPGTVDTVSAGVATAAVPYCEAAISASARGRASGPGGTSAWSGWATLTKVGGAAAGACG